MRQYFDTSGQEFFTYTPKHEKTHAFVLKGLGEYAESSIIGVELEEKCGIKTKNIYQMKGTYNPTFLVITEGEVSPKILQ